MSYRNGWTDQARFIYTFIHRSLVNGRRILHRSAPIIVIIIIIEGIYIAQVRKGHKCAMSAEMAVWLRNCLCLHSNASRPRCIESHQPCSRVDVSDYNASTTWTFIPRVCHGRHHHHRKSCFRRFGMEQYTNERVFYLSTQIQYSKNSKRAELCRLDRKARKALTTAVNHAAPARQHHWTSADHISRRSCSPDFILVTPSASTTTAYCILAFRDLEVPVYCKR